MKMKNKFGGKSIILPQVILIIISTILITSCGDKPNNEKIEVLNFSKASNNNMDPENVLPILSPTGNFNDLSKTFTIERDTTINILAVGEGVDYSINKMLIKSYDNDCVEIYFDLLNNKFETFDANGDDMQYRIVWKLLSVDGINNKNDGVFVKESDADDNNYAIYIGFPWKTLGYIKPIINREIGLDVAVDDTDDQTRKALYAWNSKSDIGWKNTSVYGNLLLGNNNSVKSDKAISINMPSLSEKNFNSDVFWKSVPQYRLKNVINGKVLNDEDLSGYFQSAWNNDFLFLKVSVRDNIKRYAQVMFDYGWIESVEGKEIWKMKMFQTKHAGGAFKNRIVDTNIKLKKGTYKLHYITDESHSPGYWDDVKPVNNFYGIRLSYPNRDN